ncbi:S-adenosyl-L-homocysteine hydrolase [Bifidobacterium ramosum]|uniref:Adenosylhomocysteinase n=1 Tax=Bifidobacterium ramosum TaxID=1798158 RepID=A0A6L4X032_9BIFI|nr:adenosylhomocysteinase [Bifidobacterium ramosum]KAB8288076.1 S-adenosyl-L-homocysteine hydrolase [Bifidobacterium ramosum]NEG72704.1 adenosylhomocysteinase [Bifidobacterium ramosum]
MTGGELTDDDFIPWAAAYSQRTNRSLAGARLAIAAPDTRPDAVAAAQQWGMTVEDAATTAADGDGNAATDGPADPFRCDGTVSIDAIPDMRQATGFEAMAYAEEHMPVLRDVLDELRADGVDFTGVRIAACLILEPKTAILLRKLKAAGAIVGVYCGPDSTDPRVAEQLRREGVVVESSRDWTPEQAHEAALRLLDTVQPDIIIDDGASFARLASLERPELAARLIGVAEETTSGVRAFAGMEAAGALTYPVVAVNDSVLKTGFDNAHGTGETCVTTMQRILGADAFAGTAVTVIGYGPVGRGFARRVRALGAQVTVCDIDPVASLKAVFDGFAARDIDDALPTADIVISATGVRHTVTVDHMRLMRAGTVLAVIGGIANEIALDDVPDFTPEVNRDLVELHVPDGPTITLIADGDGVNYTVGGGNPIEIMDLSFAVQASAVAYLLRSRGTLPHRLIRLDAETDRRIAAAALRARGYRASHAVADNGYDWTLTRFAEHARAAERQ